MSKRGLKHPPCGCETKHRPDLAVWWCGNPTYKCRHCPRWFRSLAKATDHVALAHGSEDKNHGPAHARGVA